MLKYKPCSWAPIRRKSAAPPMTSTQRAPSLASTPQTFSTRRALAAGAVSVLLAACSGTQPEAPRLGSSNPWSTNVAASPSVVDSNQRQTRPARGLPKGGGHYKIGRPYQIKGRWYTPRVDPNYDEVGMASWYGPGFHGKRTANGETYDQNALTAAHPTLPIPSYAHVTNTENGKTILVRINDRGPYSRNRILDASARVARELGFFHQGTARLRVKYAGRAPLNGDDSREQAYLSAKRR